MAIRFVKRLTTVLHCPSMRVENVVYVVILREQLNMLQTLASDLEGTVGYKE
jgi:hypothetical protein